MIMEHLNAAVERVREMGYKPIYASLYGSQNYGLDVKTGENKSDFDVKVIVMPTLFDLVFKSPNISMTVDYDGGQIDVKDAVTMMSVICKMNPQYLEALATPYYLVLPGGEFMKEVRASLQTLLDQRAPLFAKATIGHIREKIANVLKVRPSSAERIMRFGYDGKQLHHALRLNLLLRQFVRTGQMNLAPPAEYVSVLQHLKANDIQMETALEWAEQWMLEAEMHADQIIAMSTVSDDAADDVMSATRRALYESLKSEV